jgi:hypothetical protein
MDPDLYYRPAYIGPYGWIAIRTDQPHSDWDHIADRIATSWELVAPPKLKGKSDGRNTAGTR